MRVGNKHIRRAGTGYEVQKTAGIGRFTSLLWENRKIAAINTLFFVLLSVFIATVPVFSQVTGYLSSGIKAFQLLAFLGLGLLNTTLLDKYQRFLHTDIHKEKLLYTLFLSLLILCILLLFYSFLNDHAMIMAYASSSCFLLPLTIQQAWAFFNAIPEKQYKLWYYPEDLTDIQVPKFRNGIPIKFKVARKYFDIEEALIATDAPEPMIVSKRFHFVLVEQNKNRETAIEYLDRNKKPFGWKFYLQLFGGIIQRPLDPDLSFLQNNVPRNATIVVKRESVEETVNEEEMYALTNYN